MCKPFARQRARKCCQSCSRGSGYSTCAFLRGSISQPRFQITEDQAALRQIMRLRGYSLMTNVLEDYASDMELIALVSRLLPKSKSSSKIRSILKALECMVTWPLLNRNKVQDSKVNVPVEVCAGLENETIKTTAQKVPSFKWYLPQHLNRHPYSYSTIGQPFPFTIEYRRE